MPANLTPQYNEAEEQFRKAQTVEERLEILKKMLVLLPKHKGTEKIGAELKSKISDFKKEVEKAAAAPKKSHTPKIIRQGAGQIVLLGAPNVGKSSILAKLTKASPEIVPYPFTTRDPQPGMMSWNDVVIQLVDMPPVTKDMLESWQANIYRNADVVALVIDLGDDDGLTALEELLAKLKEAKIELTSGKKSDPGAAVASLTTILVGNKVDQPDANDRLQLYKDVLGIKLPEFLVSCETGTGVEELRTAFFKSLNIIRVYTKQPGKPADKTNPFTIPIGGTIVDVAGCIHQDMVKSVKSARIWGHGVVDGLTISRDHVLHDGDVVELQ